MILHEASSLLMREFPHNSNTHADVEENDFIDSADSAAIHSVKERSTHKDYIPKSAISRDSQP